MDFNKEIEALLAEDIYSVDKYIEVIKEIKNKMKKSLRNNVISENMTRFTVAIRKQRNCAQNYF